MQATNKESHLDLALVWALLIVPAIILSLLSWPHILRTVQERGLDYPRWAGHAIVLRHFHQIVREEGDPVRRIQYRRWLWMSYAAMGLALLWVVLVLVGGVGRGR
jgi:hypothetical protein